MNSHDSHRKVLITGGTGSVGRALVEGFRSINDHVTFQYYRDAGAARTLTETFGARPIQLDFSQGFVIADAEFDIVVNNAGVNISDMRTHEVSPHDWELTLRVNLTAPFQVIRQCLPWMVTHRWGRIININSIYGLRAVEGNCPYTVSKHGMSGLTKTIAKEYAALGITCNEICPGPIDSDLIRNIASRSCQVSGQSLEAYLAEVSDEIPARRMAQPKEIAALAMFLASSQAAFINGTSVPVDGAMIA